MSNDAWNDGAAGRSVTVTIKYGKGYEETWAVFRGTPDEVRSDLVSFFGMDSASVSGLTLSDVVLNATNIAHAKGNLGAKLGATVIGNAEGAPADEAQANLQATSASDVWASAEAQAAQPAENPNAALFAAVEGAADADALKRIWAENQAPFAADAELLAAWKAKGKALTVK